MESPGTSGGQQSRHNSKSQAQKALESPGTIDPTEGRVGSLKKKRMDTTDRIIMQKSEQGREFRLISIHGGLKSVSGNVPKMATLETPDIPSCQLLSTPTLGVRPILDGSKISCTTIFGCQRQRNWWPTHLCNCLGNFFLNIVSKDISYQISQSWAGRELFAASKDGSKLPYIRMSDTTGNIL